jgi:hypothetical protein
LLHRPPALTRDTVGPAWTFEGASATYKVLGKPGESVWILRAPIGRWQFFPQLPGWSACARPWKVPVVPAGTIGANGALVVPLAFPDLSGAMVNTVWSVQALCVDPTGSTSLSAPHHVVVVNS